MLNNNNLQTTDEFSVGNVELKGFSRSIAELEWFLLILVILYLVTPGTMVDNEWLVIKSCLAFGACVLAFRFLNFYRRESYWKLVIETWLMVVFITSVLFYTGKVDSPLLNLYLLVIITSGLTLGKFHTLLILSSIAGTYLYMGMSVYNFDTSSLETIGVMMTVFSPYLLIAYLTTMLSADLHYANKMFKILSETDDMTGLENLRSFNHMLGSEVKTATRYKHIFSLLMIDADGLKKVNDTHGHEAGNTMIESVANSIKSCLRESDRLARYGGDEFIVMLHETQGDAAFDTADRIRKAVENTSFDLDGKQINTTVSIGVACFPDHGASGEELMKKADRALYRSKEDGRNRVTSHSEIESDTEESAE